MRHFTSGFLVILLWATFCPTSIGQAAAEYGLGAGRAATTAAPAGNVANGISGVFDSLTKAAGAETGRAAPASDSPNTEPRRTAAHKTGRRTQAKRSTLPAKVATPDATSATPSTHAPPPAPVYEDARQIQAGIAYDELVRRFGPPSMSVTTESGANTLWYSSRDGNYQVEVQDGKVVAGPGRQQQ